jgi:RimJ/RimL family protein N-acetyltransferase
VEFAPLTKKVMKELWEAEYRDEFWPFVPRTWAHFERTVGEYETAEFFSQGGIRALVHQGQTCGFVVWNVIAPHFVEETYAVECGTYLAERFRGKGLNATAKRLAQAHVFGELKAEYAVFVVSNDNIRALSAFTKLPWKFVRESAESPGRFHAFRRRKEWETGKPCTVFSLARHAYLMHIKAEALTNALKTLDSQ